MKEIRREAESGSVLHFYRKHGFDGLKLLAKEAGTSIDNIRNLMYSTRYKSGRIKYPSMEMAHKLIEASLRIAEAPEYAITLEGLAYPPQEIDEAG